MMDMATTTLMSFAEFEQIEQGADQLELLSGELIRMPPAENWLMDVCEALFEKLKSAVERLRQATPGLSSARYTWNAGTACWASRPRGSSRM